MSQYVFRISLSFDIDFYEETLDISGRDPWIHLLHGPFLCLVLWRFTGDSAGIANKIFCDEIGTQIFKKDDKP